MAEKKQPEQVDLIALEPIQHNRKFYEPGDCLLVEAAIAASLIEAGVATRIDADTPAPDQAEVKPPKTKPPKTKPAEAKAAKAKPAEAKAADNPAPKQSDTDPGSAG